MDKQNIVFAHYKQGQLMGYRQDTMGTLGTDCAKIYVYSKEQVETVLKNINFTLGEKKEGFGKALRQINADPEMCDIITENEDRIYQQGQEAGAFEVRVLKCPAMIYEKYFDVKDATWKTEAWGEYPLEEMETWMQHPESHDVIETHYFSMTGQLNLQ